MVKLRFIELKPGRIQGHRRCLGRGHGWCCPVGSGYLRRLGRPVVQKQRFHLGLSGNKLFENNVFLECNPNTGPLNMAGKNLEGIHIFLQIHYQLLMKFL
jgi:hypothetical protein